MKIFRWQGLLVFIVLGAGVFVFCSFFLDSIIKSNVEGKGSEVIKSQIEMDSLATSIAKQAIDIKRLTVANPDNLMQNLVEVSAFRLNVDAGQAVYKKLIVDEMALEGIRLNTDRKTKAKAYKPKEKATDGTSSPASGEDSGAKSEFSFASGLDIKSPEDILKSEKLETLEAVESSKIHLQELKVKWEEKIKNELSPQAIEEIKQRIMELKDKAKKPDLGNIQGLTGEFQAIRDDIQGKLDSIPKLKEDLKKDIAQSKKMVADLKSLPQKDFDRLKKKYSLSAEGGGNLVGTLLKGPVKEKLDKFWKYYRMVSPYLSGGGKKEATAEETYVRGKGVWIPFGQKSRLPDFLVRHASLSMDLFDTKIAGNLQDLSDNQKVYGKPAVLNFLSKEDDRFDQFSLQMKLDRTKAEAQDSINGEVRALKLEKMEAGDGMMIDKGSANLSGVFRIVGENQVAGTLQANLSQLALSISEKEGDVIFNSVAKALGDVREFMVDVSIKGTMDDYELDINSNLNNIISGAVKNLVADKAKEFESSLKASIGEATLGPLGDLQGLLGGVSGNGKLLESGESSLKDLLKQAVGGSSLIPGGKSLPIPGADKLPIPDDKELKIPEGFKLPF
jgi:uncharacterized protein (TIGR03545 family)